VFATAFCWLAGKSTRPAVGKGLFLVATVMILSLGGTTWQRNLVWGNEVGLWLDVVAKSPEKPRPYNNLGHALNKAGRPWEAIPYFQRALEIAPYYSDALYNLGRTYLTVNQPAAAIPYLKRVIRIKPDDIKAYNDLGAALNGAGRYAEAAEFLEQNLSRFDSVPEIHFNLGVSYLYLGRQAEARRRLERLSRLDPQLAAQFDSLLRKGI
jgi:tetratricopeptide (TPR) repeat protein